MHENMPGGGTAQGDGYVNRGPKLLNTFDATYISAGLLRSLILSAQHIGLMDLTQGYKPLPRHIRDVGGTSVMGDEGSCRW
mgnify:CR=1 FL=1